MIKEEVMGNKALGFLVLADRLDLYKDFAINLLYCVHDFYLDKESLKEPDDMYNHFNWCFKRVSKDFEKEDLNFFTNKKLMDYLFQYYKIHFYENFDFRNKEDINLKLYLEMWNDIFDINKKDEDLTRTMIELYSLFDITITEKNKLKELV